MNSFARAGLIICVYAILIAQLRVTNFQMKLFLFAIPIIVAGTWTLIHRIKISEYTPLHYVVFGYLFAGIISVFHSTNPIYSLAYIIIYISIVLLAYHAVRMCRSEQECINLLLMIGRIILVFALVSGIFIISPAGWDMVASSYRFRGIFNHPVSYGNILVLFIIIWIGYAFYNRGIPRLFNFMICLMMLFQIFFTKSRTPLIALFLVILFLLVSTYHLRDRRRDATLLRSALFSIFIPIIPVILLQWGGDLVKFIVRGQYDTFWQLTGRIFMWQVAWQHLTHNWLFGEGFAMAGRILVESRVYINPDIVENPVFGIGGVTHLHNAWLQAAVQTNIIGTICFSIVIIFVVRKVYLVIRRKAASSSPFLTYITSGILAFTLISMMVGSTPAVGRDLYLFMFFIALFAADKYVLSKSRR